ncbi:uncharacterized protein M421DRAFT_66640 [Didymella exigua CBS 183.55]|uniref:S-adenosyl-L-methionine-dependent methyltransferase n=1 Tax=Didymella exigua CBS 183.55 TaxID=1150837 RepID=A0A6A5RHJ0_9PLEO|nr:uncharacterized protein M421DRAFT_66640 [Didymella exigua CBS 183.55]KAF1926710.1 hypothetical protein M421DRAFT_66640 [Didymella exigua CBS 183.55]
MLLSIEELPPLPRMTDKATAYAGCCLALSRPLVAHIHSLLPPAPALTLSIGSGFGLLEALLIAVPHSSNIIGVEVAPSSNTYLPSANHRVVHGTRFHEPLATEAQAWLFVYPRRVGLVTEYIGSYGNDAVQQITWIGPQADWDDYKGCFVDGWEVHTKSADKVGGKAWELIATATRPAT